MKGKKAIVSILLSAIKLSAFAVLAFVRPLVSYICHIGSFVCLIGFIFCLTLMKGESPVWQFLTAGVTLTAITWLYDGLLGWLSPGNFYGEK
ncbi:hypothetical protein EYT18_21630 [Salmonella enterica]|nr:hypothetical protein [Salmonella enterica]